MPSVAFRCHLLHIDANKKTIVLFTKNSNPNLCGPIGKFTEILTCENTNGAFNELVLEKIMKAISP